VAAENIVHFLIVANEIDCLVVDNTVHHRLPSQESSVHKEVAKENYCHNEELVGSDLCHLRDLNTTSFLDVLLDFLLSLIFKSS